MPVAKATFVKTHSHWKVYWMGGNLKWQSYSPNPIVESVEGFFDLVIQDDFACFFG
uniref:DUF3024 domain-containing protein n=1 Tax=Litoribacter populi TaxID=2598460 RepID=UPI00117E37B4|nr:DUF3024 domain-containing protein [Litoribacter populi]